MAAAKFFDGGFFGGGGGGGGGSDHAALSNLPIALSGHTGPFGSVWTFNGAGASVAVTGADGDTLVRTAGVWTTTPLPAAGTLNHAALSSNLAWGTSGHTGTFGSVAAFDGAGASAVVTGADGDLLVRAAGVWTAAALATTTPTASKIPIADGAGKLAVGWIPTGSGGVQAWSANLDSYATVAPSAFSLTLLDDADQAAWRTTLGLGSAATQTAQVAPATSRVPLSRSGLARLRPGWAREVGIGTPTAGEDNTLGYEVGDTWTYQGRHYVAESVATGAANWIAGLIASDATATPTASKIPIADGAGKLAAGWIPIGSGGVQAWDADLDAYAASPATATPTASRIPVADGSGLLDGWISPATPTTPGLGTEKPVEMGIMGRQTVLLISNIPAAATEIPAAGGVRAVMDCTAFDQFMVIVNQVAASNSGAAVRIYFSTTPTGTPALGTMADLAATPAAGDCVLSTGGTQTTQVGSWTTKSPSATGLCQFAATTVLGDGSADPTLRWVTVLWRKS